MKTNSPSSEWVTQLSGRLQWDQFCFETRRDDGVPSIERAKYHQSWPYEEKSELHPFSASSPNVEPQCHQSYSQQDWWTPVSISYHQSDRSCVRTGLTRQVDINVPITRAPSSPMRLFCRLMIFSVCKWKKITSHSSFHERFMKPLTYRVFHEMFEQSLQATVT